MIRGLFNPLAKVIVIALAIKWHLYVWFWGTWAYLHKSNDFNSANVTFEKALGTLDELFTS